MQKRWTHINSAKSFLSYCWRFHSYVVFWSLLFSLFIEHMPKTYDLFVYLCFEDAFKLRLKWFADILKYSFFRTVNKICSINWKRHFKSITELNMTLNRLCYRYTRIRFFLYRISCFYGWCWGRKRKRARAAQFIDLNPHEWV